MVDTSTACKRGQVTGGCKHICTKVKEEAAAAVRIRSIDVVGARSQGRGQIKADGAGASSIFTWTIEKRAGIDVRAEVYVREKRGAKTDGFPRNEKSFLVPIVLYVGSGLLGNSQDCASIQKFQLKPQTNQ